MLETICIMCPMGCNLKITEKDGEIVVSGNTCPRGAAYGRQEYTEPKRVVTTLVRTKDGRVVSVKTPEPVAKEDIDRVLDAAKRVTAAVPLRIGDAVAENVDGKGAKLVATKEAL